jgi:alkaline phosphatase D
MPRQFERPNQRAGLTRRRLLAAAGAMAATAIATPLRSKMAYGQPRLGADPFVLSVASGDPVAACRLRQCRCAGRVLRMRGSWTSSGVAKRSPPRNSVHVDVTGLEPDCWYYYRFIAGGEASPTGRTRTFPPIGSPADRLRFAFASCQHYGQGYFTAYDAMMEDDLDLIVHLGDYIYKSDWSPKVRFHCRSRSASSSTGTSMPSKPACPL